MGEGTSANLIVDDYEKYGAKGFLDWKGYNPSGILSYVKRMVDNRK